VSTEATRSRIGGFILNLAVSEKSLSPGIELGRVPDIMC